MSKRRTLSKGYVVPPAWRTERIPGQIPGRQTGESRKHPGRAADYPDQAELRETQKLMTEMPKPARLAQLFDTPMMRPEAIVANLGLRPDQETSWGRFLDEVFRTSGNPLVMRQRVAEHARECRFASEVRRVIQERSTTYWNEHMAKAQQVLVYSPDMLQKAKRAKGGSYHRRVVLPNGKVKYFYTEAEYKAWPGAHLSGHEVATEHAKRAVQGLVERAGPEGVGHEHLAEVAKEHGGEATAAAVKHGLHEGGHYVWKDGRLHRRDASHDLMHKLYGGEGEAAEDAAAEAEQPVQKSAAGPFIGPRGGKWADPEHTVAWQAHQYQGAEYKKSQERFVVTLRKAGEPAAAPAAPRFTVQQPAHTPRQVTPIGGITPGGYKRVAADVYVPVGQEARQPGQPEQPGAQQPQVQQPPQPQAPQPPAKPQQMVYQLQQPQVAPGGAPGAAAPQQPAQQPIAQQAPAAAAPVPIQAPVHQQPTQVQGTGKRKWIDHLEGMPKDTQKHWMDPATGDYKPERKKLHDQIVGKFLAGKQAPPPGQKVAVVMMGGTASGKSTLAKNFLGDKFDQFVNVNPDDVKDHLPEYQKGVAASAKDAAFSSHEESADVSERVLKEGVANGLNVLVDGTGKNAEKHIKRVQDLQAKGYQVHLLMPDVDTEEAIRRSNARAEKRGRYVPTGEPPPGHPDIVRPMYQVIPKNFETVARNADGFTLYDTRQGFPRPVWSGGKGQQDQVHDPQFVAWFKQQHGQAPQPQQQVPAATAMQQGGQPAMAKSETGKPAPQPQAQPVPQSGSQAPSAPGFLQSFMAEGMANTTKAKPEDWKEEWEGKPAEHAPGEGAVWPVDDVDYDLDSKVPQSVRKQQANGGAQSNEGEKPAGKPRFTIKGNGRGGE